MKRPERPVTASPARRALRPRMLAAPAVLAVLLPVLLAGGPTAHAAASPAPSGSSSKAGKAGKASPTPTDAKTIRSRLAAIADAYARSESAEAGLRARATRLRRQAAATGHRIERTHDRIAQTATAAYTSGGDTTTLGMFTDGDPDDVVSRMTALAVLGDANDGALRDATGDRVRLARERSELAGARTRLAAKRHDLAKQKKQLNKALLAAAKRAADRANRGGGHGPKMTSGGACPVGHPYTLTHTFGAPRGGGRSHEGTDIPAPKGTPIYAVEDGTISRAYSNTLGGIAIILRGKSGDEYYYAHQEVNLVHTGQRVVAGQQLAKVGMTGDAMGTIYHLHFELWPGGGNAVDSYPMLFALCGKSG